MKDCQSCSVYRDRVTCCNSYCDMPPCYAVDYDIVDDLIYNIRQKVSDLSVAHTRYLTYGYGAKTDSCYKKEYSVLKRLSKMLGNLIKSLRVGTCFCVMHDVVNRILEVARLVTYDCISIVRGDIIVDDSNLEEFKNSNKDCYYRKPWDRILDCFCVGLGFESSAGMEICDLDYNVRIEAGGCSLLLNEDVQEESCDLFVGIGTSEEFCELMSIIKSSIDECKLAKKTYTKEEICNVYYEELVSDYSCELSSVDYYNIIQCGKLGHDAIRTLYECGLSVEISTEGEVAICSVDYTVVLTENGDVNIKKYSNKGIGNG